MNKKQLIKQITANSELSHKDASKLLEAFLATVKENLKKGEKVNLSGFGSFMIKERKEHTVKHPVTKQVIKIPKASYAAFRPGTKLKKLLK